MPFEKLLNFVVNPLVEVVQSRLVNAQEYTLSGKNRRLVHQDILTPKLARLHAKACANGSRAYVDPMTGYDVF